MHLQLVALKIIDYTKAETQQQRRIEIERELTILHPNFVPLGQVGTSVHAISVFLFLEKRVVSVLA